MSFIKINKVSDPLLNALRYYQDAADEAFKKSHFYHNYSSMAETYEDRTEFLLRYLEGKKVLHLGFVDAPYTKGKAAKGELLHQKLQGVTKELFGLDFDKDAIEDYRKLTDDVENGYFDLQSPAKKTPSYLPKQVDIILLGEILEHLPNPGIAINNLAKIAKDTKAQVVITVPNAFFIGSFAMALEGYEGVHPDHYFYFTPATLDKLLKDNGFSRVKLSFYIGVTADGKGLPLAHPGLTKNGIIAICNI